MIGINCHPCHLLKRKWFVVSTTFSLWARNNDDQTTLAPASQVQWARNNDDQTTLAPASQVQSRRTSPECVHDMSGHPGVFERAPRHPVAVTIIGFCMCFYYVLIGCEPSTSFTHARAPACGSIISSAFYNSHLSNTFISPGHMAFQQTEKELLLR